MNRHHIDILAAELAQHGVAEWRIDRGHHHPRLCFMWRGRERFLVVGSSPSDWRAVMNMQANLRRMLRG